LNLIKYWWAISFQRYLLKQNVPNRKQLDLRNQGATV
jgi:hypothetical protein